MYNIIVNALPLAIWLLLTMVILAIAKRRHIGRLWALYFAFLSPVFGFLIVIFSKSNRKPIVAKKKWWQVAASIIIAYGLLLLFGGLQTTISSQSWSYNRYRGEAYQVDKTNVTQIFSDTGGNIGRVIVVGPLALTVDIHTYSIRDYRYARFHRLWLGLFLISFGVFILTNRKEPTTEEISISVNRKSFFQNLYSKTRQSVSGISVNPGHYLRTLIYIGISVFAGFISGWYYKILRPEMIDTLLKSRAAWRKELYTQKFANEGFFFNPYYHFNWLAFIITSFIVFFFILFLYEKPFRMKLIHKIKVIKEEFSETK